MLKIRLKLNKETYLRLSEGDLPQVMGGAVSLGNPGYCETVTAGNYTDRCGAADSAPTPTVGCLEDTDWCARSRNTCEAWGC